MCWRRGEVGGAEDGAAASGHCSLRGEGSWERTRCWGEERKMPRRRGSRDVNGLLFCVANLHVLYRFLDPGFLNIKNSISAIRKPESDQINRCVWYCDARDHFAIYADPRDSCRNFRIFGSWFRLQRLYDIQRVLQIATSFMPNAAVFPDTTQCNKNVRTTKKARTLSPFNF